MKCNGPMEELSLPDVVQTFIFMGTGYSLAVKCCIRVLHSIRSGKTTTIRLQSVDNEKEMTSARCKL